MINSVRDGIFLCGSRKRLWVIRERLNLLPILAICAVWTAERLHLRVRLFEFDVYMRFTFGRVVFGRQVCHGLRQFDSLRPDVIVLRPSLRLDVPSVSAN